MPSDEQKNIFLQELEKETKEKEEVNKQKTEGTSDVVAQAAEAQKTEEKAKKPKKKMSPVALFATMFLLFLFIVSLFIFIMSVGGAGNPILKTFGVPEDSAKSFLISLVNGSFATFATILLIIFAITLFIAFSTKKDDKLKRKKTFVFSAVCGGLIFPVILIWLGMYSFVNAFVVERSTVGVNIEYEVPDEDNVYAPIDVTFSVQKIREAIEKKGFKITSFRWDFGTGSFQKDTQEDTLSHHFTTSGKFIIRVEVVTDTGETQIFEEEFNIKGARFEAVPDSGNAPLRVQFNASEITTGISPDSFDWDFDGDGVFDESSGSSSINHTFEQIGKYQVKLRVLDNNGNVKLFEREIEVFGEDTDRVQAKISVTPGIEGQPPYEVQFDATESFSADADIVKYEWQFNDGTPNASGDIVTHTFTKEGEFGVKLTITDEFGTSKTSEVKISVKNPSTTPEPVLRTIPKIEEGIISGLVPLTVKLDAADSFDKDNNIVRYEWDFDGDSIIDATGGRAEYTYRDVGEFELVLMITDADGNVGSEKVTVKAEKQNLTAIFSANPETGPAPLTVKFDASSSWCDDEDCHILSYEWDFGDDTEPQLGGAQIQHMYTNIGIYDVKLTVYSDNDKTASAEGKVYVREIPLTACFDPSRTTGVAPLTVSFDPSCTTGPIEKWQWDFGDGVVISGRRPTHTFQAEGTYTVSLRVSDDKNNVSETQREIVVQKE